VALVKRTVHAVEPATESPASGRLAAVVGTPGVGDVPTWDGSQYIPSAGASGPGSMVPTYIAPGETFTVLTNHQALFTMEINNEGTLIVDGFLVEVD
jgi:hypothetical protein